MAISLSDITYEELTPTVIFFKNSLAFAILKSDITYEELTLLKDF